MFHVMDPYELEFPFSGMVEFEGLEQIPKMMTRPREIRKSYLREVEAFRTRLPRGVRAAEHALPVRPIIVALP